MFGLHGSLLFPKGNSSVSVSKSAKERSSNVLLIAALGLLLAVHAVVTAGLLTISLLVLLGPLLIVEDSENTFSNFTTGLVIVVSSCDAVVVEFGSEIMGDEGEGQILTTLLINAFDDNGEDDMVQNVFDVVVSTMFCCTLIVTLFVDDVSTS